jgi:hypothetical protein
MTGTDRLLDALRRRSAALISKDVDGLLGLLHPDFVYVNASGWVLTRDEYLDHYVRPEVVRWIRQDLHEPVIAMSGGTAVVTFLVHDVARFGDMVLDETFRSTLTWIQVNDAWACLGGHTCACGPVDDSG